MKRPSQELSIYQSGSIILIGGESGIGKTSIINTLINNKKHLYSRPLSYTTRPRRHNESDNEYIFVGEDSIYNLYKEGSLINIDDVYGYKYAIDLKSINNILAKNMFCIKEIHPQNHFKIKDIFSNITTVLFVPDKNIGDPINRDRVARQEADKEYYNNIKKEKFDIIIRIDKNQPISYTANNLHLAIYSLSVTKHYFPNPVYIDDINLNGYSKIAPEFNDKLRITTRNFHEASANLFEKAITNYIKPKSKCLEIGPGTGWLQRYIPVSDIEYRCIEISPEMNNEFNNRYIINSTVRYIDFPDKYFDIVIASLADPYFYPTALCEIRRVLKDKHVFIFSLPSKKWAYGLRKDNDSKRTTFKIKDGTSYNVFSFTYTLEEIERLLSLCGFSMISYQEACMQNLGHEISPAITESAEYLGIDILKLSIIDFVICERI